jgi:hypothetical protein
MSDYVQPRSPSYYYKDFPCLTDRVLGQPAWTSVHDDADITKIQKYEMQAVNLEEKKNAIKLSLMPQRSLKRCQTYVGTDPNLCEEHVVKLHYCMSD